MTERNSLYCWSAGISLKFLASPEGRLHLEDGEGPVERRLARVMMALEARGFFSAAEHQEGLSVLWGTALEDLETEGASSFGPIGPSRTASTGRWT